MSPEFIRPALNDHRLFLISPESDQKKEMDSSEHHQEYILAVACTYTLRGVQRYPMSQQVQMCRHRFEQNVVRDMKGQDMRMHTILNH